MALIKYVVFHPWKAATVLVVGTFLGLAAFYAYQLNTALGAVATDAFNPEAARAALYTRPQEEAAPTTIDIVIDEPEFDVNADPLELIDETYGDAFVPQEQWPTTMGTPIPDEEFESYLLLGSDASGALADVMIYALQPRDGSPIMVSLPRDLWIYNLCKERFTRLNEGLNGCKGVASRSEMMAIMVEDYTGIPVDHVAQINFSGFKGLINVMGGISVCVDFPTRDVKAHLDIPAGCQRLYGDQALAWVRSRRTEQLKSPDNWVRVAGSDFARQKRQQDVLFQLAGKAKNVASPAALVQALGHVSNSVKLDSGWSFTEAVATGWRYRGISKDDVLRFTIETDGYRTPVGQAVLIPLRSFTEQLSDVYDLP